MKWILSVVFWWTLSHAAWAQELLLVEWRTGGGGVSYSSQATEAVQVVAGQAVTLVQSRGTDYRLAQPRSGWAVAQVEQVPAQSRSMSLLPTLTDEGVQLQVQYQNADTGGGTALNTTVAGPLGQWITVLGAPQQRGSRYSSSSANIREQLSVRVSSVNRP